MDIFKYSFKIIIKMLFAIKKLYLLYDKRLNNELYLKDKSILNLHFYKKYME